MSRIKLAGNKSNEENKESTYLKTVGYIFMFIIFIIYPLAFHNKLFDVMNVKLILCYIASAVAIVGYGFYHLAHLKGRSKDNLSEKLVDLAPVIALIVSVFFTYINYNYKSALLGDMEFGVGIIFMIVIVIAGTFVSRTTSSAHLNSEYIAVMAWMGMVLEAVIVFLQFIGLDPFGLITPIEDSHDMFIGTMGNIAFAGCYFVATFPFMLYLLHLKNYKVLGLIGVAINSMAIIMTNNDGTILAWAVELVVLFAIMSKDEEKSLVFFKSVLFTALGLFILKCFVILCKSSVRRIDFIPGLFISWIAILLIAAVGAIGVCLIHFGHYGKYINRIAIIVLLIVCLYPAYCIIYTLVPFAGTESFLGKSFYFNERWGTDRGYLWKSALGIFWKGSAADKIFGQGAGSFNYAYFNDYFPRSQELGLYPNLDAHNIYLQFLCEYGIFGVGLMVGLLVARLVVQFKSGDFFQQIKMAALIGIMVSSAFLIVQGATIGLLLMVI